MAATLPTRHSAMPAVDVHAHFVPEHMPPRPPGASDKTWPSMAPGDTCCHRHVMVNEKIYRTVTDQCWSAPRRIEDMRASGVTRQVLSPMPELLSYWMPAHDAAVLHRDLNQQMAQVVAEHPGQFAALAAVPLQDVEVAIVELEHAATALGMAGAEIGSNVNGVPIGDARFEPFFAAAERLGMAIFVHAIRPAGMDRLVGPPVLEQVVAFPNEIGFSAASVITSNLLVRHPRLRIAFSHGGGSLAMQLPRMQHAWKNFPVLREKLSLAPFEQARLLYYDTLVYDRATLLFLIERYGPECLMLGTDYPFNIMETDPLGRLAEAGIDDDVRARLSYRNAERFLGAHA